MDKLKVRKFKNQQKRLAKKIAKAHKTEKFCVSYEQQLPSAYVDVDDMQTVKTGIRHTSEIVFPTFIINPGRKHRVVTVMNFVANSCDSKIIGKILKRQFTIKSVEKGFEVRSSYNPNSIGKLSKIS